MTDPLLTQTRDDTDAALTCSVVIPTRNRPGRLARCLAALAALDYPRDSFEVVVIDDGSDQPLDSVVATVQDRLRVRLLRKTPEGPARARNYGVEHSIGELIAFTDDDCEPEPNWLRALATAHAVRPNALLGGHTWNALTRNAYSMVSQLLVDYLYEYYNVDAEHARFFTSNNIAADRFAFLEMGGFDPIFQGAAGEDRELCARWRHEQGPLVYVPEARVAHSHSMTLRSFTRQHFGYGRGALYFRVRESERDARGVRVESPHFYSDMFRFPFRQLGPLAGVRAAALLMLAQVANAAGFFWESRRKGGVSGVRTSITAD